MKGIRNLLLCTALAGLMASPALAESGTLNAELTATQTITITETAPLKFGTIGAMVGTGGADFITVASDGSLSTGANVTHFGGHSAGVLEIGATQGTTVALSVGPAGGQSVSSGAFNFEIATCIIDGGPQVDCRADLAANFVVGVNPTIVQVGGNAFVSGNMDGVTENIALVVTADYL